MSEFEPVAVIGFSCRLPQAPDPDTFWNLLSSGTSAISAAPPGRWVTDALPHRFGGFIDQIDQFDPEFFGISPREAVSMDPQQRLMLELSWEALERAKIVPGGLRGSQTGVFMGAMWDDYATLLAQRGMAGVTSHS